MALAGNRRAGSALCMEGRTSPEVPAGWPLVFADVDAQFSPSPTRKTAASQIDVSSSPVILWPAQA